MENKGRFKKGMIPWNKGNTVSKSKTYREEYNKKYYEENKERIIESSREYYNNNKEEVKRREKNRISVMGEDKRKERIVQRRKTRKTWRLRNKAKIKETNKAWNENNPDKKRITARKHSLKKNYRLSFEEYDSILKSQNYCCRICGEEAIDRVLCVDHCHSTGQVRGLLCGKCNKGLGMFNDDEYLLVNAAAYLNFFKVKQQTQDESLFAIAGIR